MSWLQRFRIKSFLRNTVWFPPLLGMVGAILIHKLVRMVDLAVGWEASVSSDGARALLGTLSASMFTFIVFVFSILLLSVQLASAQLTPRVIAVFYRNLVLKFSLTFFVFAFTFSLAVLFRIGDSVMQISLWIAGYSCLASIGIFLYMIDNVGKSLRPISLLNLLGSKGQEVITDVYPKLLNGNENLAVNIPEAKNLSPLRIIESRHTGVVLAFDISGLVELARHANCLIGFVPQVGDFVTSGDPLFRVYPGGESLTDDQLQQAVAIGPERTMEQDPGFAFRMIVDIASKALSPAINDPTTAVLALDQIHRLLRVVAMRHLATGKAYDNTGQLRLIFRTPDWDDFLNLAITEIRIYGKDSLQVVRRIRAMLEDLIALAPSQRTESLKLELQVLNRGIDREFQHPEDRLRASVADSLGMGGSR
ncbi:MAG: DUF2254 domain-containing protein [Lentimicrobium sp.]